MSKASPLLLVCLIMLLSFSLALADDGGGNKYGRRLPGQTELTGKPNGDPSYDLISVVTSAVNEVNSALPSGGVSAGKSAGCVEVSLTLPDSIVTHFGPANQAVGLLELTNCGDTSTVIMVSFEASISAPGVVDTILTFGPRPVPMDAGQTISHPIRLHFPPIAAFYKLCVTAVSGDYSATSCDSTKVIHVGPIGFPIHAWGVLVQGTGCVVFQPFNWCQEHAFLLDNYGVYVPGDTVHVEGGLVPNNQTSCPEADGWILNNTIDGNGPDPGLPYNGCGVLIQGTDCVLFSPQGGREAYVLEHYGPFVVGDSVCVRGFLEPNCESACSGANGCVHNNTISPMQPSNGMHIEGCGVVLQGSECVLFQLFREPYPNLFSVEHPESLTVGDTVCLHGWINPDCEPECSEAHACLSSYVVDNPNPPNPFEGCGILVQGSGCVLFQVRNSVGTNFLLDSYGTFGVGDSVCVSGMIEMGCDSICPEATACLRENFIRAWEPDTVINYQGCGVLVQDSSCLLFVPHGAGYVRLALGNYGSFGAGDSVCVAGMLIPNSPSTCPSATGFLAANTITGDNNPNVPFSACGYLVQIDSCLLFVEMGLDSVPLVLQNYGGFGPGDSVCVQGDLVGNPPSACPAARGFLANNTITGGNPQNPPYSACGVLAEVNISCLVFMPAGTDTFSLVLQNTGGFGPGDTVCVQGTLMGNPPSTCPGTSGFLANNTITGGNPVHPPYSGCGVIVPMGQCRVFVADYPDTLTIVLQNYGTFGLGDSVCVQGTLVIAPPTGCPWVDGMLVNNTITGSNPQEPSYSACGVIFQMGPCKIFAPDYPDTQMLLLQNYGGFGPHDSVCVQGTVVPGHPSMCSFVFGTLINNTIWSAHPDSSPSYQGDNFSSQNYPNPFNPETSLRFSLPQTGQVTVKVYNSLGQLVKVLADRIMSAGEQQLSWNGTDDSGRSVASGVYFYRIEFGGLSETRKMLLMK
jgi:hypothetical protein